MSGIVIQERGSGMGVVAQAGFEIGETVIISSLVREVAAPTMHSIQTGVDTYIEIEKPARLLNHSCNPNVGAVLNRYLAYDFICIRQITRGEQITFDYETTELELARPFACECGFGDCRATIRGFKYRPEEIMKRYGQSVAGHLRKFFKDSGHLISSGPDSCS